MQFLRPEHTRGTFVGNGCRDQNLFPTNIPQPEFHPITSSRYYLLRGENDSKQSDEIEAM